MNWTIQDFGAVADIVGAIGVIVTLGYLAYQIRQNTLQLKQTTLSAKAAAVNACNNALRETRYMIFETPEMTDVFLRGNQGPEALDEIGELRYRLLLQNITEVMVDIYTQTSVTNFSPETWETQGTSLVRRILSTRGGRRFWEGYNTAFPRPFQTEVDRILSNEHSSV